jgi:ABC-type nickel/cobalt efflux system permease component RcnA
MADKRALRCLVLTMLAIVGLLATSHLASAHPLGNFSISHYTAIRIEPDAVVLRYLIDMAEIPTFQEIQDTKIVPQEEHASLSAYLAQRVEALQQGLVLELNGQRLPLRSETSEVIFPPGAGGLPTLKLGISLCAPLDRESAVTVHELRYRDTNFPGRTGWKEIIAASGPGIALVHSTVPEQDRSHELADYPADLLNSPPQDVEARVRYVRQAPAPALAAVGTRRSSATGSTQVQPASLPLVEEDRGERGEEPQASTPTRAVSTRPMTPRSAFTELVTTQQVGFGIVLTAMAVAVGLGAFHALEPGHGKTVVAAYLIGSRGTAWHAMMLGLIVTVTHTAGVYLLGAVTLLASHYVMPERLYPWLGVISGLIIAGLGLSLLLRRYAGSAHANTHEHGHGHTQAHGHVQHQPHGPGDEPVHLHAHYAHPHHPHRRIPSTVSPRELLALGVTGGIVPCPAALVVLLSALSLNRVGFGLLLIVAFSLGLAAVLIAIGILMVYAQRLMARFQGDGVLMTRWLPLTSATVMTIFGVAIAVQALVTAGILQIRL